MPDPGENFERAHHAAQILVADGLARWGPEYAILNKNPAAVLPVGLPTPSESAQIATLRANTNYDVQIFPRFPTVVDTVAEAISRAAAWPFTPVDDLPAHRAYAELLPDATMFVLRLLAGRHPADREQRGDVTVGQRIADIGGRPPTPPTGWRVGQVNQAVRWDTVGFCPWACHECAADHSFLIAYPQDTDPAAGAWLMCRCSEVVEITRPDSAGMQDVTALAREGAGLAEICRTNGFGPVFRATDPTDPNPPTRADGFPISDLANLCFDGDQHWRLAVRHAVQIIAALPRKVHGVDDDPAAFGLAALTVHALSLLVGRPPESDEVVRAVGSGRHALYGLLAHHLPDDKALSELEAAPNWRRRLHHWPSVDHATRNRAANYAARHDPRLLTSAYLFDTPAGRGPDFPKERTEANAWQYRRAFETLTGWLDA